MCLDMIEGRSEVMKWGQRHLVGKYDARDICQAAKVWVPEMQEAGADGFALYRVEL